MWVDVKIRTSDIIHKNLGDNGRQIPDGRTGSPRRQRVCVVLAMQRREDVWESMRGVVQLLRSLSAAIAGGLGEDVVGSNSNGQYSKQDKQQLPADYCHYWCPKALLALDQW
jgi:hypothetical protein